MTRIKRIISKLFSIPIFNRIIVIVALILFLIIPVVSLQFTFFMPYTLNSSYPSLLIIGAILGIGAVALYKPTNMTLFFFIELFFIMFFFHDYILNLPGKIIFNIEPIFNLELIYCTLALFIFFIQMFYVYFSKKNLKKTIKEDANHDSIFEFLCASDSNKKIEKKIENIAKDSKIELLIKKKTSLSKICRFLTYIPFLIFSVISLSHLNEALLYSNLLTTNIITSLFIVTISFIFSFLAPKDFKYVFFFNIYLFTAGNIIISYYLQHLPFLFIIISIITTLNLIITMIPEGRRWMGAKLDA